MNERPLIYGIQTARTMFANHGGCRFDGEFLRRDDHHNAKRGERCSHLREMFVVESADATNPHVNAAITSRAHAISGKVARVCDPELLEEANVTPCLGEVAKHE